MRKIGLCTLIIVCILCISGCGKSEFLGKFFHSNNTTRGIYIGEAYADTIPNKMIIPTLQIVSDIKGARKDFLDEYFKNQKQAKDYDQWENRLDDISRKINDTIGKIRDLQILETDKSLNDSDFNIAKEATIEYLDSLNKALSNEKAKIQSAKNKSEDIDSKFLSFNNIYEYNGLTYRNYWYMCMNFFDGVDLFYDDVAKDNTIGDYIPGLNINITYGGKLEENGTLGIPIMIYNSGDKDFELNKFKIVIVENGNPVNYDLSETNRIDKMVSPDVEAIIAQEPDIMFKINGVLPPGKVAIGLYAFTGLDFTRLSELSEDIESENTIEVLGYYNDQLVWYEDLSASHSYYDLL